MCVCVCAVGRVSCGGDLSKEVGAADELEDGVAQVLEALVMFDGTVLDDAGEVHFALARGDGARSGRRTAPVRDFLPVTAATASAHSTRDRIEHMPDSATIHELGV